MKQREIKFRASVTDANGKHQRWAYGTPEFGDKDQLYIHEGTAGRFLCERDTLGQFTGLHDKYGREIYEGDVVSNMGQGPKRWHNAPVEWKRGAFVVEQEGENDEEMLFLNERNIKVIGNIHLNPELAV